MEFNTPDDSNKPEEKKFPENSCQNCGHPDFESNYSLKLCSNCRTSLSSLKIPAWLKIVSASVLVIFIISVVLSREAFNNFINYKKAEKVYSEKKYQTALNYYSKVKVKDYEKSVEIKSMILFCHYYNYNIDSCIAKLTDLEGETFHNDIILHQVESISKNLSNYMYNTSDSLPQKLSVIPKDSLNLRQSFLENRLNKDTANLTLKYLLADLYFDKKEFEKVIVLLKEEVKNNIDFQSITSLLISSYRELKQFDKGIALSNNLLDINSESITGICALSKLELKRKNDKKGLELAQRAYSLDSTNYLAIGNMAIASFFNNNKAKSEYYFQVIEKIDPVNAAYYRELILPKSNWRN